eukprot:tig00001636_g9528.t1
MSWFTLAFHDAEEEEAYLQEWARDHLPTLLRVAQYSLVMHAAMLLLMKLWDASLGLVVAQATYVLVLAALIHACVRWVERPRRWHLFLAVIQLVCYVADVMPLVLDPAPVGGGPFGPLRFYAVIPVLAVVLAGGSACAAAVVYAAFSLAFVGAYARGAFPWAALSSHDYVVMSLYVFWGVAIGYFHEARIRQAWVLARRLRRAAEAADAGLRAKSLFLSNCNHELRTPLHGIIGMTELLEETELSGEQRDFLDTVRRCTETLLAMVCDILDLEKASSGQLETERRPFALRGPLEAATDVLYLQAAAKDVDLACSLEAGLADARVVGDEMRVRQIVINLASNAMKFSAPQEADEEKPEAGGSRRGPGKRRRGQVLVRAERAEGPDGSHAVRIAVRDNGIGIPADRMGALFRPFSQLEAGHTRVYGGTGLGLSLVKSFAEQMGGSVSVASTPGEGSTFAVLLPLPLAEAAAEAKRGEAEEGGKGAGAAPGAAEVRLREWRGSTREALEAALGAEGWALREGAPLLLTDCPAEAAAARLAAPRRRVVELRAPSALRARRLLLPVKLGALRAALRARPAAARRTFSTGSLGSSPSSPAPLPAPQRATRVLIAEDNEVNARLLSRMLGRLGFPHDSVPDGEAAVDACRSGRYGLLITDIQMPRKSGWEACEEVRALQAAGAIASPLLVVGCSANATAEDRERSRRAGMAEHLSKPCRLEQLRALLDKLGLLEEGAGGDPDGAAVEGRGSSPPPLDLAPSASAP